jgi:hypothetical protein
VPTRQDVVLSKIDRVRGYVSWDGKSDDAADSEADNLDREYPCGVCGWAPGESHDDDECDYEPDLPAVGND